MSKFWWYLIWPYRCIRSTPELLGGVINICLQVLMMVDRLAQPATTLDSSGLLYAHTWAYVNMLLIAVQVILIVLYFEACEHQVRVC